MSDETPPPSLRLKPRQRSEGTPPATPGAPAAGSSEPESGKIRLKPKLTPEPAPAESAAAAEPEPVREKIRLKPQTASEPAATPAPAEPPPPEPAAEAEAPAPEPPKVKLKIKIPGALTEAAAAAAAAAEPAPEASASSGKAPPPFPVVAMPGNEAAAAPGPILTRPGMPGKPGVPGRNSGPPIRRLPPGAMAASARRKKFLKAILVALGGVAVAAGMIALAISKFINPQPPSRVPKPREVVTTPFVETPTSIPEEVAPEPTHPKQKSMSGVTTTSATTDLAPGVTVTSEDVVAEIEASQSFRSFVADAKISGVFQGTPPRAFINGRLIRVGETVDSSLGIRFESIDPKTKSILFKDTSGATVSRRY